MMLSTRSWSLYPAMMLAASSLSSPSGGANLVAATASNNTTIALGPLEIPFDTRTLGPDGPWNFITLNIGPQLASNVSFYPQTMGDISFLASPEVCSTFPSTCPDGAQYYSGQTASTQEHPSGLTVNWQHLNDSMAFGQSGATGMMGDVSFWTERFNAPLSLDDVPILISKGVVQTWPGSYYAPVSLLQLDCRSDHIQDLNKTRAGLTWPLLESSRAGRPQSYNLHLGSATFDQPGSLYFGGYDSRRIIEPMHPFITHNLSKSGLSLLNVTFETLSGPALWPSNLSSTYFQATAILNKAASGLQAALVPEFPYMALPEGVCKQWEDYLPIKYDMASNLYLWQQEDPLYRKIMSSPSYLNFTFIATGPQYSTFSIKVPLASLNLTLESPPYPRSVAYFPCWGLDTRVRLGRAFLQSANLGYATGGNGTTTYYYLGQAPGPSIGRKTTPQPVTFDTSSWNYKVPSGAPSWEETWSDTWQELGRNFPPTAASTPGAGTGPVTSSLSRGALAGIVVGSVVGAALVCAMFYELGRRRAGRRRRRQPTHGTPASPPGDIGDVMSVPADVHQLHSASIPHEKDGHIRAQLDGRQGYPTSEAGRSEESPSTSVAAAPPYELLATKASARWPDQRRSSGKAASQRS